MTIISHTHKFVFFKPRKVGGSSLLVAFGQHCRHPDVVTAPGNTEGFLRNAMNCTGIPTHTYPEKIKAIMEPSDWKSYKKITCVRNPWDVAISMLFWKIYREHKQGIIFSDTARNAILNGTIDPKNEELREQMQIICDGLPRNNDFYLDQRQQPWADVFIRYEAIQSDYDKACDLVGLPRSELPRLKGKARPQEQDYRIFYDDALRDLVYEKCATTIDYFDYKF